MASVVTTSSDKYQSVPRNITTIAVTKSTNHSANETVDHVHNKTRAENNAKESVRIYELNSKKKRVNTARRRRYNARRSRIRGVTGKRRFRKRRRGRRRRKFKGKRGRSRSRSHRTPKKQRNQKRRHRNPNLPFRVPITNAQNESHIKVSNEILNLNANVGNRNISNISFSTQRPDHAQTVLLVTPFIDFLVNQSANKKSIARGKTPPIVRTSNNSNNSESKLDTNVTMIDGSRISDDTVATLLTETTPTLGDTSKTTTDANRIESNVTNVTTAFTQSIIQPNLNSTRNSKPANRRKHSKRRKSNGNGHQPRHPNSIKYSLGSLPDYLRHRDRRQLTGGGGIIQAPLLSACKPGAKRDYNYKCRPKFIPQERSRRNSDNAEKTASPVPPRIKCPEVRRTLLILVCPTFILQSRKNSIA